MTDDLKDTPFVGRTYCPGCEPDADPIREVLTILRCWQHQLEEPKGTDDERVPMATGPMLGAGDAEGSDCRRVAELLRQAKR